jgi:hypothetical protein
MIAHMLADLQTLASQYPTYGTRRMTHQLRRSPFGCRSIVSVPGA